MKNYSVFWLIILLETAPFYAMNKTAQEQTCTYNLRVPCPKPNCTYSYKCSIYMRSSNETTQITNAHQESQKNLLAHLKEKHNCNYTKEKLINRLFAKN